MTTLLASQDKTLNRLRGHLTFFDFAMIGLEQNPSDQELLGQMHRGMLSIRASARQAGLPDIETIANDLVELFDNIRQGVILPTEVHVQLLHRCFDALEEGIEAAALDLPTPVTLENTQYELRLAMAHEALTAVSA